MVEMDLFLNKNHNLIHQAVLYIDNTYERKHLERLLRNTDLDELIITGNITEEKYKTLLEFASENVIDNNLRIPPVFRYCHIGNFVRPVGSYALLFEGLKRNRDILCMRQYSPDYLIGRIQEECFTAFSIWEEFRSCSKHIQIVTLRNYEEPQVLDWEKDNTNNIELSVIFPMYNVEKYLPQCVESVTAWQADYVEFLFINDGSPDNSREIVLEYAKTDSRIKVLDKPNGGCASARQWGLEHAKGRYIGFIDPDDFIDKSMYRKLLRAAMIGSYEISYCGYYEYYESNGSTKKIKDSILWPYNKGVTNSRDIQQLIAYCRVAIWRGIYKNDMLKKNNIHFYTDIRRYDDLPFKVETFAVAQSVIAVEEHLYYYRLERPGQDVSADDERLYVHFSIFNYLNESIGKKMDRQLIDLLQLCKIQTHTYAMGKIKPELLGEYKKQAKKDIKTTGSLWRTFILVHRMLGKKSAFTYLKIMF